MKKALAEAYTMTVSVRAERGDHFRFDLIVSFSVLKVCVLSS